MNRFLAIRHIIVALIAFAAAPVEDVGASQGPELQAGTAHVNSIRNFAAVDVSGSELQITVDYYYTGEAGSIGTYIQALPQARGGVFDAHMVYGGTTALAPGDNRAILRIAKSPKFHAFSSDGIRVCMSAPAGELLCESFPFAKLWDAPSPVEESGTPAEIISFVSSSSSVDKGGSVTLSWQTANTTSVLLGRAGTSDFENVPTSGSRSVSPAATTTYALIASQSRKTAAKVETLQVSVVAAPVIGRFSAGPSTIRKGLTSKLTWDVYNADHVTLDGEEVTASGDRDVSPQRTKSYTLRATNGNRFVTEHATVAVSPFMPPTLSPPFHRVELCRDIDESGESFRCISPDGPFWANDEIHVIVRFKGLSKGRHTLKRIVFDSGVRGDGAWKSIHEEEGIFPNDGKGFMEIRFQIHNVGKGVRKLQLVLDDQRRRVNVVPYCVECPGHDEW